MAVLRRAIIEVEVDMRRVEGRDAMRHVTTEDCFAIDNIGVFANKEDSATRRTAQRSFRLRKKRVGNLKK